MAQPILVVFGLGCPNKHSPSILGSGVGGHAVRIAAAKGYTVRAVARDPFKYTDIYKDLSSVSVVKGDVTDAQSVAECLKGATACIFAVQAPDDMPSHAVDQDGVITVAKECVKAKCKLVVISSMFVSPKHHWNPIRGYFNRIMKQGILDAKWEGEEAIRHMQGLRYTIIRPGGMVNQPSLPNELQIGQGETWGFIFGSAPVPKMDIAQVAFAAVIDPNSDGVTCEVTGSRSPNPPKFEGIFTNLQKDHAL